MTATPTAMPAPKQGSAPRALEIGDIAPAFRLTAKSGEEIDPAADHISGKVLVLGFLAPAATLPEGLEALAEKTRAMGGRCFLVVAGAASKAAANGFDLVPDPDGKVSFLYGAREALPCFVAGDRKSTRLNSSHIQKSRMPSSA